MMLSTGNFFAILGAAIAAWIFGAAYYMPLGKAWLAAQGRTMAEMQAANAGKSAVEKAFPFVLSFIAEIIMAWTMYSVLFHTGNSPCAAALFPG